MLLRMVFVLTIAVLVLGVGVCGAARASQSPVSLTLYAVPMQHQYVNNADDRARGEGNNPFGNYSSTFVAPPPNEKLFGPFAGDEGDYAFRLYTGANLKKAAGSATFLCMYDFNQNAFCDAAFDLNDGSLIGKGFLDFNASTFTLAIVGGTAGLQGTKGNLRVVSAGSATQAQPVRRVAPMLERQRLSFLEQPLSAGAGGARPERFTVFTLPSVQTFINNNDDEARGDVNNPFGTIGSRAAERLAENGNGPFAGDETLFAFTIYGDKALKHAIGHAAYTCQYFFGRDGFCDATFQLNSGTTLVGAGAFNFSATNLVLAITGSYGGNVQRTGEVDISPRTEGAAALVLTRVAGKRKPVRDADTESTETPERGQPDCRWMIEQTRAASS